jgi:hypothetical protein
MALARARPQSLGLAMRPQRCPAHAVAPPAALLPTRKRVAAIAASRDAI